MLPRDTYIVNATALQYEGRTIRDTHTHTHALPLYLYTSQTEINIYLHGKHWLVSKKKKKKLQFDPSFPHLNRGHVLINQGLRFPNAKKFQTASNTSFRSVKNGKRIPAPRIRGMPLESICFMRRWKGDGGRGGRGGGGGVTIVGTHTVTCCAFGWPCKKDVSPCWSVSEKCAAMHDSNSTAQKASRLFLWDGFRDEVTTQLD